MLGSSPNNQTNRYFTFTVRDLFSSHGTMALVDRAVADCLAHERLTNILGKPIKAFGELIVKMMTFQWSSCILRAGLKGESRSSIPATQNIDSEGRKGVRIHFYVQGVRRLSENYNYGIPENY